MKRSNVNKERITKKGKNRTMFTLGVGKDLQQPRLPSKLPQHRFTVLRTIIMIIINECQLTAQSEKRTSQAPVGDE